MASITTNSLSTINDAPTHLKFQVVATKTTFITEKKKAQLQTTLKMF